VIKTRIVTDLSEGRALWERFVPVETIWDFWDVRACFHRHFRRPICFIVAEGAGGDCGFLPLSWVEESGCHQYFPGETWHGASWVEHNRIVADSDETARALLNACPGQYHLRYLTPNSAVPMMLKTVDELSYRFLPQQYGCDMQAYFREFSGKSLKRLKRETASIESSGAEYRYDVQPDFERMLAMNQERFGVRSYFNDRRFLESFRSLFLLFRERGWLRLTSLHLAGDLAAVDLGAAVNGIYTLMGGGTNAAYPGVAKSINLHHMQRGCAEQYAAVDFMCGDFSWKNKFHLASQPLYLLSNAAFAAAVPESAPVARQASPVVLRGPVEERVLVVGTTSDYIDYIRLNFPGRAVFVTDPSERAHAAESAPAPADEVLCPLDRQAEAWGQVRRHLAQYNLRATGVACFDCESMRLASFIARDLRLPYPSDEAVVACRSKFISRRLWQRVGLACPAACQIENADEAVRFFNDCGGKKTVLKPLTGSGSELVFVCETADDCVRAFSAMRRSMAGQLNSRMYAPYEHEGRTTDPRRTMLMEEFVEGLEYSCDFMLDGDNVEIIRVARKWPKSGFAPGTIMAYAVPEIVPGMAPGALERQLGAAARALGIERAICMADFIMGNNGLTLLEIASRPGGDCMPELIRSSSGLDIIRLALDFAQRLPVTIPPPSQWRRLVGLRFFTSRSEEITAIDANAVSRDPRVLEVKIPLRPERHLIRTSAGFPVRFLGHAIFQPDAPGGIEAECRELDAKLTLEFAEILIA